MKKLFKILLFVFVPVFLSGQDVADYPWYWQKNLSPVANFDTVVHLSKVKFGVNGTYIDSIQWVGDTAYVYSDSTTVKWIPNPGTGNIDSTWQHVTISGGIIMPSGDTLKNIYPLNDSIMEVVNSDTFCIAGCNILSTETDPIFLASNAPKDSIPIYDSIAALRGDIGTGTGEFDTIGVVLDVDLSIGMNNINTGQSDVIPKILAIIVDTVDANGERENITNDVLVTGYTLNTTWYINIYSSAAYDSLTIYYIKDDAGIDSQGGGGIGSTTDGYIPYNNSGVFDDSPISISGIDKVNIADSLIVDGNSTLGGTLDVSGVSTFSGNISFTKNIINSGGDDDMTLSMDDINIVAGDNFYLEADTFKVVGVFELNDSSVTVVMTDTLINTDYVRTNYVDNTSYSTDTATLVKFSDTTGTNKTIVTKHDLDTAYANASIGSTTDGYIPYNSSGIFVNSPISVSGIDQVNIADSLIVNSHLSVNGATNLNGILFTGTTKTAGAFYTGTINPTSSNRLNFDGGFYATSFYISTNDAGLSYNDPELRFKSGGANYWGLTSNYLGVQGGQQVALIKISTPTDVRIKLDYDSDGETGFFRQTTNQFGIKNNGIITSLFTEDSTKIFNDLYVDGNTKLGNNVDDSTYVTGNLHVDGNMYINGYIADQKYETSAYTHPDSTIVTSITTDWSFLGGGDNNKFTNFGLTSFAFDGDTLYFDQDANDDRDSIKFHIAYTCESATSSVNKTIFIGIFIKHTGETVYNEEFQCTAKSRTSTANIFYAGPICTMMPIYLKDGDKIHIMAKCEATSTTLSNENFKINLSER